MESSSEVNCIYRYDHPENPRIEDSESPEKLTATINSATLWGLQDFCYQTNSACTIEPDFGWAISKNNKLIKESLLNVSAHLKKRGNSLKPSFIKFKLNKKNTTNIESAIVLLYGGNNYWHFYNDILGALHIADKIGIDKNTPILVSSGFTQKSFFKQAKALFPNFMDRGWIELKSKNYAKLNTAYFITTGLGKTKNFKQSFDLFPKLNLSPEYAKIFVSRRLKYGRSLKNLEEIENLMREKQYKIVYCEDHSIVEQKVIFSSANICIAIHGAALTNIYHSANMDLLVEIFPENRINPCFYWGAYDLGINYKALLGTKMEENGNFTLALDKLTQTLNSIE